MAKKQFFNGFEPTKALNRDRNIVWRSQDASIDDKQHVRVVDRAISVFPAGSESEIENGFSSTSKQLLLAVQLATPDAQA